MEGKIVGSHPDLSESLKKRTKIDRYSKWMYNMFKNHLGTRILDIGSGTGNMISHYVKDCETIVATDIFEHQIDYIIERFKNQNNLSAYLFDIGKDNINNFKSNNFNTITCINVLEHIENDIEALEKMKDLVCEEGKIIILVPAFNCLYGTMDKVCGHHRRYDPEVLKDMASKLDLEVIEDKYFNALGIIPWFLKGKVLKKKKTFSDELNDINSNFYNFASMVLEPLEKMIRMPIGISEVVIMKK
ncbi:MAG: class I SAM-dependent methyltransferase [Ignavibacteriales bacterium]